MFRSPISAEVKVITLTPSDIEKAGWKIEANNVTAPGTNNTIREIKTVPDRVGLPAETELASSSVSISQWGEITYFPLSAGFGGSKTLSMTLDEFGSVSSYGWKSNASGNALTTFSASAFESIKGISDVEQGETLAEKKAEIDELETQQKLNKLRECEAIIKNGGYNCSEDES